MRKYFVEIGFFLIGLAMIVPNAVFAVAYNDLVFDNDTNISVGGFTLVVSSVSEIAGLTVNESSLDIDLMSGSRIKISSTDRSDLSNSVASVFCLPNYSYLDYTSTSTQTMTVVMGGSCGPADRAAGGTTTPTPTPTIIPGEKIITAGAGGTVSANSAEGGVATVQIPINAVSADTVVIVAPVGKTDSLVGDPPSGSVMVGGYVYQFTAAANGEAITEFAADLTLTFTYTDDQVEGIDESSLAVYYWDSVASVWVALESAVNIGSNTITATTNHFTDFAIMGEESTEDAAVIAQLEAQIVELQTLIANAIAQLTVLLGHSPLAGIAGIPADFSFKTDLSQGMNFDDVKNLQMVLNSDAVTRITSSGAGSSGNETSYFGILTKSAVVKFQEKYASTCLVPWGLSSGTGFVGATTREKLNSLLGK